MYTYNRSMEWIRFSFFQSQLKTICSLKTRFATTLAVVNLILPGSEEFFKVTKEIIEAKTTERQNVFGVQTVNNAHAGNEGLLRRRKMSTVLEPTKTFSTEIELRARKASFPAMNVKEVYLELSFPGSRRKANSCSANWGSSLVKDLPSIVEVPEDEGIAIYKSKSKSEGDLF